MVFFPPQNVNVKCFGILHDDYVEIHMGEKVRNLKYSEISFIRKTVRRGLMTWYIDTLFICDAVGMRVNDHENRAQIDEFVGAIEQMRGL